MMLFGPVAGSIPAGRQEEEHRGYFRQHFVFHRTPIEG